MQEVRFRKGETIFAEGDSSEHCYKIVSGKVEIFVAIRGVLKRGRTETIAICGAGDIIGEMSVIDGGVRSASAIATEPTVCMAFTAKEILDVLQNDPQEALSYVRMLINRLRRSNRKLSSARRHLG
jgi:CRP-like cAMP-binding protein